MWKEEISINVTYQRDHQLIDKQAQHLNTYVTKEMYLLIKHLNTNAMQGNFNDF